ncbi:MAG TPA: N-acetyltransferase [Bacteroidetes bacterium]|nr:N-acetyltransferase [Bacteroidota bacterium]
MILENYETPRLKFRSLCAADRDVLKIFFENKEAVKFLNVPADPGTYIATWIGRQESRYESMGTGLCALILKETGEMIGHSGLVRQFVDGIPKWEVGYHLLPAFWGRGYATEAAIACRNYCFENEMAETLISLIHPENKKSIAVAKRNGMAFWKTTLFKGQPSNVYRVRREDWEKMKASVQHAL